MKDSNFMKGAEALVRSLEVENVEYIFGIPGHGNMHILDAIYQVSDIKFMLTRHEQGAVHIADGYARVKNKVGVCCSSVGAGAANMVMGIGTAAGASSPVLAISGGIISSMYGKGQLQATERPENKTEQSYIQVLQPLVKKAWMVGRPELIPYVTHEAFTIATAGRPGPVAIEIPWDVQAEKGVMEIRDPEKHIYGKRMRADRELTLKAAERLITAKFPVILAGNGAEISGAGSEIRELAELLEAPVATSLMAKGILSEDHELSIGMVGWLGHQIAHEIIREHSDYILAVGFRFSDEATSFWTEGLPFVKENKIIQIDLIPQEIGRNYPVEVGLLGDAKAVLQDIISIIKECGAARADKENTIQIVRKMKEEFHVEIPEAESTPIEPIKVAEDMRKLLPRNAIIATDTGNHAHYFSAYYPVYGSRRLLCPGSWTPMGFGPAAIIGAKLAEPETPCVCVTGDGGFYMVCQEVITAVEWNMPVVWVVFNNQTLNAIRLGQKSEYNGNVIATEFGLSADFAAMAKSFHAEGIRVEHQSDLVPAIEHALHCGKPCVVDVIVNTDPILPPVAGDFLTPGQHIPQAWPRGTDIGKAAKRRL
jgi:Thiamine pyrophosphate-requiring enzymes [acetolactate synthase, pyruvate dehydrogenase (cytochrome), glyoxylate carboligase, phosphonopyruvate decarboxylase]